MPKMVQCAKLGRELEGFDKPPWPGELGQRIAAEISKEAWQQWLEHAKMLINERHLNLATTEAQMYIAEQMEKFLWGGDFEVAEGYVAPEEEG